MDREGVVLALTGVLVGILFSALLVMSVPPASVEQDELWWAEYKCFDHQSVASVRPEAFFVPTRAVCMDGAVFYRGSK